MTTSEQKSWELIRASCKVRQHMNCSQTREHISIFFSTTSEKFRIPNAGKAFFRESHEITRPLEEGADKKGPSAMVSDISGYFPFEKYRFRPYIVSFYSSSHHSHF